MHQEPVYHNSQKKVYFWQKLWKTKVFIGTKNVGQYLTIPYLRITSSLKTKYGSYILVTFFYLNIWSYSLFKIQLWSNILFNPCQGLRWSRRAHLLRGTSLYLVFTRPAQVLVLDVLFSMETPTAWTRLTCRKVGHIKVVSLSHWPSGRLSHQIVSTTYQEYPDLCFMIIHFFSPNCRLPIPCL